MKDSVIKPATRRSQFLVCGGCPSHLALTCDPALLKARLEEEEERAAAQLEEDPEDI